MQVGDVGSGHPGGGVGGLGGGVQGVETYNTRHQGGVRGQ